MEGPNSTPEQDACHRSELRGNSEAGAKAAEAFGARRYSLRLSASGCSGRSRVHNVQRGFRTTSITSSWTASGEGRNGRRRHSSIPSSAMTFGSRWETSSVDGLFENIFLPQFPRRCLKFALVNPFGSARGLRNATWVLAPDRAELVVSAPFEVFSIENKVTRITSHFTNVTFGTRRRSYGSDLHRTPYLRPTAALRASRSALLRPVLNCR